MGTKHIQSRSNGTSNVFGYLHAYNCYLFTGFKLVYCFFLIFFLAGRGRGRGSYQSEAPRARFGSRNFGRGSAVAHEGGEREYNRSGANGFYRSNNRQEQGSSSGQPVSSRSGQNPQE